MPADTQYDEVHALTKDSGRYGCWGRPPYKATYPAMARVRGDDGVLRLVEVQVEFLGSRNCRSYMLWDTDSKCAGCTVPRDHEYKDRMESMA